MPRKGQNKTFANKRTINPPTPAGGKPKKSRSASSFQQQDPKRRLGGFAGAGEHPRNTVRRTASN
jgi:hypothetical protein